MYFYLGLDDKVKAKTEETLWDDKNGCWIKRSMSKYMTHFLQVCEKGLEL